MTRFCQKEAGTHFFKQIQVVIAGGTVGSSATLTLLFHEIQYCRSPDASFMLHSGQWTTLVPCPRGCLSRHLTNAPRGTRDEKSSTSRPPAALRCSRALQRGFLMSSTSLAVSATWEKRRKRAFRLFHGLLECVRTAQIWRMAETAQA